MQIWTEKFAPFAIINRRFVVILVLVLRLYLHLPLEAGGGGTMKTTDVSSSPKAGGGGKSSVSVVVGVAADLQVLEGRGGGGVRDFAASFSRLFGTSYILLASPTSS